MVPSSNVIWGHDRLRIHIQRVAIGVDRKCAINFKGGFDGSISRVDVVQIYIDDGFGRILAYKRKRVVVLL